VALGAMNPDSNSGGPIFIKIIGIFFNMIFYFEYAIACAGRMG